MTIAVPDSLVSWSALLLCYAMLWYIIPVMYYLLRAHDALGEQASLFLYFNLRFLLFLFRAGWSYLRQSRLCGQRNYVALGYSDTGEEQSCLLQYVIRFLHSLHESLFSFLSLLLFYFVMFSFSPSSLSYSIHSSLSHLIHSFLSFLILLSRFTDFTERSESGIRGQIPSSKGSGSPESGPQSVPMRCFQCYSRMLKSFLQCYI